MKTIADGPGPANRLAHPAAARGIKSTLAALRDGIRLVAIAAIVLFLLAQFRLARMLKREPR